MSKHNIEQALGVALQAEEEIFFAKLASYGVVPKNDEDRNGMLQLAREALSELVGNESLTANVKQASASLSGREFKTASNGYSEDAGFYADKLMGVPAIVGAVQTILAAQNL